MEDFIFENEEIGNTNANSTVDADLGANQIKEFKPKIIGLKKEKVVERAFSFYLDLTKSLNEAFSAIGEFLGEDPDLNFFLETLKSKSIENQLLTQFAIVKKIQLPGLSLQKIILAGYLDYPLEPFQLAIEKVKASKSMLKKLQEPESSCNLFYPLRKLFDRNKFVITAEFEEKVGTHFFRFTTCQTQNDALELLEDLAESINRFHYAGFIDLNRNPTASLGKLLDCIDFERNQALACVSEHCFYRGFPGVPKQTSYPAEGREFKEIFS